MAAAAASLVEHIHHERQEAGSMLCAQHALNALLQGPLYDPSQLADIAKRLDELEQSKVDEQTWRSRDNDSLNMDDTGFFSVSVLENALEVWGLRLVRWRSEEMRPFQSSPETQLAFVLNLESHWFTIRGFMGGYWFNLNSFLEGPSWVGSSYLGALLNAAESEGYSVFAVVQANDAQNDFYSSVADECAATLPPASVVSEAGQSASGESAIDSSAQGLKPSVASASSSAFNDEEADLQAALRASLAEADARTIAVSSSTSGAIGSRESSRLHSPTIAGQRRARGRGGGLGAAGDAEMGTSSADMDEEETDEQVDEIAPSRRRVRGLGGSRSSPYVLPPASGGRRRASRHYSEEGDASSLRRRRQRDAVGSTRENAIDVDVEAEGDETQTRSTTLRVPGDRTLVGGGDTEEDGIAQSEDEDEFVQMNSSSAPRSPFLNPAMVQSAGGSTSDDDFHSLSSGDEGVLGESWVQGDIDAVRRQGMMQDRSYDDEDAQLQAALAASMREAGHSPASAAEAAAAITSRAGASEAFEDDLAAASWINEEDSKAIREAQASFSSMVRQASSNRSASPPPPDVERIARMRAEAKRKLDEEEAAKLPGGSTTRTTSSPSGDAQNGKEDDDQKIEEDSDDDEPQLSPEEMRRARLARFGGP